MEKFSTELRFLRPPGWLLLFFANKEIFFGRLHIAPPHFFTTSIRSAKSSREIVDNFLSTFFTSWLIYWNGYYSRNERTILSLSFHPHFENSLFLSIPKLIYSFFISISRKSLLIFSSVWDRVAVSRIHGLSFHFNLFSRT